MHETIIIDNFLEESDIDLISSTILDNINFPWYYFPSTIPSKVKKPSDELPNEDYFQFVHIAFSNNLPQPINGVLYVTLKNIISSQYFLNYKLQRIKCNLLTNTQEKKQVPLHIDSELSKITAIYYVNTNNGYTEFESGERVKSVRNRLLIFDAKKPHFGTTCTDKSVRAVINFNFY